MLDNPDKDMPLSNDALVRLEKSKVLNKYLTKEYVKIYVDLKKEKSKSLLIQKFQILNLSGILIFNFAI